MTTPHAADSSGEPSCSRSIWPSIPGYEILGELGQGGMGIVYRALQVSLKRIVALKVILSGSRASPDELSRFRTEAEAIARLPHPGIVAIYEIGEYAGQPFFSLEFCSGGSLEKKLAGKPLPPNEAAALVERLAEAMQAAHEKDVIHRDLKPANVLLTEDGTPKVTDFGLAKKLDEQGLTQTGAIMGTASYLPPEQARGERVDASADTYALGAILYECLTGQPPFRAASQFDTLVRVINDEPLPPRRLNSQVPLDLETICLKCLRKQPQGRYVSAGALAADLTRYLASEPIKARPPALPEKAWRWLRRHPALATLTAAAVFLVAGAFVFLDLLRRQADELAESEKRRRIDASRAAASASYDRGWEHAVGGDPARGLLWMARALREAPPEDENLARTARTSIAGWRRHVHPLRATWGHGGPLRAATFSPDGKLVVTIMQPRPEDWAFGESTARLSIWSVETGDQIGSGAAPVPCQLWFSADGRFVAAVSDRVAPERLGGELTKKVKAGRSPVLVLDAVTKSVVKAPQPGTRWQVGWLVAAESTLVPAEVKGAPAHWSSFRAREVSPSDVRSTWHSATGAAARAFIDRRVELATGPKEARRTVLLPHRSEVLALLLSPDGRLLLTGAYDGTAQLWAVSDGTPLGAPLVHGSDITSVDFSPDGKHVLTASHDGTARLWDLAPGAEPEGAFSRDGPIFAAAFGPAGDRVALAGNGRRVTIHDLVKGQVVRELTLPGLLGVRHSDKGQPPVFGTRPAGQDHTQVRALAFSPDGKRLAAGAGYPPDRPWIGAAGVFDLSDPERPQSWHRHFGRVHGVAFSPDGRILATCSYDGSAWSWEETGVVVQLSEDEAAAALLAIAFSPDGRLVATAGYDRQVRFHARNSGQEAPGPLRHAGIIHALAFGPDGKRLATGSGDRTAQVWELASGKLIGPPLRHPGEVLSVAFSPDGDMILTGCDDGFARLWDARTWRPLAPPWRHPGPVHAVAFDPCDERIVLTAGGDRAFLHRVPKLLEASPEELTRTIERETGLRLEPSGTIRVLRPDELPKP